MKAIRRYKTIAVVHRKRNYDDKSSVSFFLNLSFLSAFFPSFSSLFFNLPYLLFFSNAGDAESAGQRN